MQNALFIARHDLRYQLRQGTTLVWIFLMPPVFMYFIGTVTSGFSGGTGAADATPLTVIAEAPGFLQTQIDMRLRDNDFEPDWNTAAAADDGAGRAVRTLTLSRDLSRKLVAGEQITARFDTRASALQRDVESIRIQRSLYTVLADIVAADARAEEPLTEADLAAVNAAPRIWRLDVQSAGRRPDIPSGFQQSVPGILVMFTLLVLLTSGASMLARERTQGLLRRLASAPISQNELVIGKWCARMVIAALQIGVALLVGTLWLGMRWGPDVGMVILILGAWAAFCASAGLLLGGVATTAAQASGLGVLLANVLAALGGCWWPIEITPAWMQFLQKLLPTGWTMDALHRLISFEAGASHVLPHLAALLAGSLLVAAFAARRFRYQ